ncbi:TetR/AcrR family transcriptional regulator [Vagococcus zengguangii]|uniref:TetR/AcrR family transcriptional regulator n=1 Tax=Vagococcus zengguangii TaxID=2571750 RepID=A0A4D7CT81_9ENTE|nr:TetR/AcrR family transcriptional regulator [Vagococcus zengguangii]QCI86244.1 TetR/AcrR family transcriptional regulator [Vagococcus zengguangii]TLG79647.1 TetR/AcrR family transcriptional regulator [Vagococcus zengguangii]
MTQNKNEAMKREKRAMILDTAREIFGQKGYANVTMADIVHACGISRGGLYLYFPSIEELFQEVVIEQSKQKFTIINQRVANKEPFEEIFEQYLELQKNRLLNIDDSILVATYEYYNSHQEPEQIAFQKSYVDYLTATIRDLLTLGKTQGVIANQNIPELADMFIMLLEGISIFKTFKQVDEHQIIKQLNLLKNQLIYVN